MMTIVMMMMGEMTWTSKCLSSLLSPTPHMANNQTTVTVVMMIMTSSWGLQQRLSSLITKKYNTTKITMDNEAVQKLQTRSVKTSNKIHEIKITVRRVSSSVSTLHHSTLGMHR